MESREKEGKLNEAEKVEQKLELGSKQKVKTGSIESGKKNKTLVHDTHRFSFAADVKVATVGMNGVEKMTPAQYTQHATQETKNLPGDQSRCPTCSLTFTMCTALYSSRLTGSSGDASLAILVCQFSK